MLALPPIQGRKHQSSTNRPLLWKEKSILGPFPMKWRNKQERRGPQVGKTSWLADKVLDPFWHECWHQPCFGLDRKEILAFVHHWPIWGTQGLRGVLAFWLSSLWCPPTFSSHSNHKLIQIVSPNLTLNLNLAQTQNWGFCLTTTLSLGIVITLILCCTKIIKPNHHTNVTSFTLWCLYFMLPCSIRKNSLRDTIGHVMCFVYGKQLDLAVLHGMCFSKHNL